MIEPTLIYRTCFYMNMDIEIYIYIYIHGLTSNRKIIRSLKVVLRMFLTVSSKRNCLDAQVL